MNKRRAIGPQLEVCKHCGELPGGLTACDNFGYTYCEVCAELVGLYTGKSLPNATPPPKPGHGVELNPAEWGGHQYKGPTL